MKKHVLKERWGVLDARKGTLLSRCEKYAYWTIPSIFPSATYNTTAELLHPNDSLGAKGLNHMSNKVTATLFRPNGFFRLSLGEKDKRRIKELAARTNNAQDLSKIIQMIESELATVERDAIQQQDMVSYRPNATLAAKLLIATGNALEYHPEGRAVQIFNVRDYCVVRDLSGEVIEIMTRESKAFETFHPDVQIQIRALNANEKFEDSSNIDVYTQIRLEEDGKYHVRQEAGGIELDIGNVFYPKDKLRWIPLTWSLIRGEDYGRGLVEEYAAAFAALEVYNQSLINIAAIAGDVKFLVNPASLVDVHALNTSKPGSYHAGKEGDVAAIQVNKQADAQFILTMIERLEKQIAHAFLLNSQMIRDAERVTTEEIRMIANELESSNGGVYSRLAQQWQVPVANILLEDIGFDGTQFNIRPQIITGMDGLSRQGEMDNLRLWVSDLSMLDAVPEDVRATISKERYAEYTARQRQVDYTQLLKTPAEIQAEQQQQMQQQQQLMAQQEQARAAGTVAAEAGKAAVTEG